MSGKAKRPTGRITKADALTPERALQLREQLDKEGKLPDGIVLEIVRGDYPPCCPPNSCKANRKDNPSCFCGLVPHAGSFRKKGLWQKETSLLNSLGADPEAQKRQVCDPRCRPAMVPSADHMPVYFPLHEDGNIATRMLASRVALFLCLSSSVRLSWLVPCAHAGPLQASGAQQSGQHVSISCISAIEAIINDSRGHSHTRSLLRGNAKRQQIAATTFTRTHAAIRPA